MDEEYHGILYHGTSTTHIDSIFAGMKPPSHWGTPEIARCFAETACRESGGDPVLVALTLDRFDASHFADDEQMLEFPMVEEIGAADHGILEERWERSAQTWRDCLTICHAVVYHAPLTVGPGDVSRIAHADGSEADLRFDGSTAGGPGR